MKRHGTASGKAAAARRLKTASRKRRSAPKVKPVRAPSVARLEEQLDQKSRELNEALEQQKATGEILRVISSSPGELGLVFQVIIEKAVGLCDAKFGGLFLHENGTFTFVARFGTPPALAALNQRRGPFRPSPGQPFDRMLRTRDVVHIADELAEPEPTRSAAAKLGGARSNVVVPMLQDNALVGAMSIYRQEARPFTEQQIALVQTFAAQAVIAIENTRLLNELRQRTADLTESLEQQTATSDVLKVISSSPGELEPVFETMLANAVRICEAKFGVLHRFDGDAFHFAATVGTPPEFAEFQRRRGAFRPPPGSLLDRVLRTKQVEHTADQAAEAATGRAMTLGGARSTVCVPMVKDDVLIGAITIYRQEVRAFTDKQIALVQNFAAQAVIAIENTRLLSELRRRTPWNSRPRPRTCYASSARRQASWSRYSAPCWRMRCEFATQNLATCSATITKLSIRSRSSACRRHLPNLTSSVARFNRRPEGPSNACCRQKTVRIADASAEPAPSARSKAGRRAVAYRACRCSRRMR